MNVPFAAGSPTSLIVISPLARIAEMAVRHRCCEMVSLLALDQSFHRPAVIQAERHLRLGMNDITFSGYSPRQKPGTAPPLTAPQESHVADLIDFARGWDQSRPLLVHCWMGVSRSPAAAAIVALTVDPDQDDTELALRLRAASPFATPNSRLVEIGDSLLGRQGKLAGAMKTLGRGADADGNTPFLFSARPQETNLG